MISLPHSSESSEHDDQEHADAPDDPRLRDDDGVAHDDDEGTSLATSTIDSDQNMPGDQPHDDTPPPRQRATGDAD